MQTLAHAASASQPQPQTLQTYAYGIPCARCQKPLRCGYVELPVNSALETLRDPKNSAIPAGQYVTCDAFDATGDVCGESTFVRRSALIFVD